jgi:sugar O-acyltransferase (sialic acid O-acetyltransferase NeuD family)
MEIEKLTILGLSAPTLTMITDGLESMQLFPKIRIVNNLGLSDLATYENPSFEYELIDSLGDSAHDVRCFLGVNRSWAKEAVYKHFKRDVSDFINIIHQTSSISKTVQLGNGVLVNSLVSIASFAEIGNFVSINRNASIGHHTVLEDFVSVNPGANIAGFVRIGRKSLLGIGVNVIDGITIGKNTIVGAGAVVTKDLPDNVVAYGNPCVVIRKNEA